MATSDNRSNDVGSNGSEGGATRQRRLTRQMVFVTTQEDYDQVMALRAKHGVDSYAAVLRTVLGVVNWTAVDRALARAQREAQAARRAAQKSGVAPLAKGRARA